MRKLLKSFLIATASIGTIAGSTAAVVSCGSSEDTTKKENQAKYDAALKELKDSLTNTPISINVVHGSLSAGLDPIKTNIETAISTVMGNSPTMIAALGAPTVTVQPGTFNDSTLSPNTDLHATGLSLVVKPKVDGLTQGAAITFDMNYRVINNAQDNYNQAVESLLLVINAVEASVHTFYHTQFTTQDPVKTYIMDAINASIADDNQFISKFTDINQLPDISANITTILSNIANGPGSVQGPETLVGIHFISKVTTGVDASATHNITFSYVVVKSKADQFAEQTQELIKQFIDPDTASFKHSVLAMINNITAVNAIAVIQAEITRLVTLSPVLYSAIDTTNPTIKGLTDSTFDKSSSPADYSTPVAITGVTIAFSSSFPSSDNIPPSGDINFPFYYTVAASTNDVTAYSNALKDIVNHFIETTTPSGGAVTPTNPISFDYDDTTDADAWKSTVAIKIKAAIYTYVSTSVNASLFSLGSSATAATNNIQVTITGSNFVNNVSTTATKISSGISFSIPSIWTGTLGVTTKSVDLAIYKTVAPVQALVTSAADKIKTYFNAASHKITMKRLGIETENASPTKKSVQEYIADAINTYISATHTGQPGDVGLTENEKAALGTIDANSVTDINGLDISTNATDQSKSAIHLTIPGSVSAQSSSLTDFTLHYDVVANANDNGAQTALSTIITQVITNSTTTPITLVHNDSSTAVETAIKTAILNEAKKATYNTYFQGVALSDITISAITTGTGDDKVQTDTVDATGKTISGTGITATIAVKTGSTTFAVNPTPVALTGLKYSVAKSNQELYNDQSSTIVKGFETYTDTHGLDLYTHISDADIKQKVRDLFIAYLATLDAAHKNLVTPIAADQAGLDAIDFTASTEAGKSFDTSTETASATTRTSSTLQITLQPAATPAGLSATPATANIKYTVGHGAVQSDYNSAMNAIKDYFANNSMFTVKQDSTLDTTAARPLIQDAVYAYINHAAGAGFLTDDQKAALKVSAKTDITVANIASPLVTTALGNQITSDQIKITIPSYLGVSSAEKELTGAIYNVEKTDAQKLYESQVDNAVAAIGTSSTPIKLLDTADATAKQTAIKQVLDAYITAHASDATATGTSTLAAIPTTNITGVDGIALTPGSGQTGSASITFNIPGATSQTGLHAYTKAQTIYWESSTQAQLDYKTQVQQVLDNFGTATNKVTLYKGNDDTKVKGSIVSAINTYITANASTLTAIKIVDATNIADTGIDTSAVVGATTHSISITIPKSDSSTATVGAVTKTLNYIVLDPQPPYDSLLGTFSGDYTGDASIFDSSFVLSGHISKATMESAAWIAKFNVYFNRTYIPSRSAAVKAQMLEVCGKTTDIIGAVEIIGTEVNFSQNYTIIPLKIQIISAYGATLAFSLQMNIHRQN